MKKAGEVLICITWILLMVTYGKNSEVSLKSGIYTLQNVKRDVPGDFTITIYEDGTFQYCETPISSYIGMGHYSIEKDIVTLKEDTGGCTGDINYYQIVDGNLFFIRENSANYNFVPLEDEAQFICTSSN